MKKERQLKNCFLYCTIYMYLFLEGRALFKTKEISNSAEVTA